MPWVQTRFAAQMHSATKPIGATQSSHLRALPKSCVSGCTPLPTKSGCTLWFTGPGFGRWKAKWMSRMVGWGPRWPLCSEAAQNESGIGTFFSGIGIGIFFFGNREIDPEIVFHRLCSYCPYPYGSFCFYDPYFKEKNGGLFEYLAIFLKDLLTKIDDIHKLFCSILLVNR